MSEVLVKASNGEYSVLVQNAILSEIGEKCRDLLKAEKLLLVTDDQVDQLYAAQCAESLVSSGYDVTKFVFPHGEKAKTMATVTEIVNRLADSQLSRSDAVIALGGGICGDMAGFASAIFLRGIPFVQLPTTLLAMVDSSVGGKTGVNLAKGKNLAGAFWQPAGVFCDPLTLNTLPAAVLREGLAEVVKHGVLADPELFARLKKYPENLDWEWIITRNVQIKASFVTQDPYDQNMRQLLNFGHTFGHAIEKNSHYEISHGNAVAMGMIMAARAAEKLDISQKDVLPSLKSLLSHLGFSLDCPFDAKSLAETALVDKKRNGSVIRFVFPEKIGKCRLVPVDIRDVRNIFELGVGS